MPIVPPNAKPRWLRLRLVPLIRLLHEVPGRLRWRYRTLQPRAARPHLCLVSPRGAWWRLKLQGGFFITRIEAPKGRQIAQPAGGKKRRGRPATLVTLDTP